MKWKYYCRKRYYVTDKKCANMFKKDENTYFIGTVKGDSLERDTLFFYLNESKWYPNETPLNPYDDLM